MASLIESVRKLHAPTLIAHDNGYDVDVICEECTRLRLEALDQAAGDGEDLSYSAESARVPYPCHTRTVAGTTAVEGKEEASRMRLERLVVQREGIEEQIERLDAVIALIRRDLGEDTDEADGASDADDGPEPEDSPEPEEDDQPTSPRRAKKAKAKEPDADESDHEPAEAPAEAAEPGEEFDF
ncbi:MAG TPA: hypothetical protein VK053_10345 [Jiangellaceae bacterium]|nr:hypothetical protein [Jiangellaceae bacterium]